MKKKLFPDDYLYLNDTLCIAKIIEPIGNNDYKPSVARWNMATGEINPMPYEYPDLKKVRFIYAASAEHQLYVQCYTQYDLMTICDFNGNLKCNIYGPKWVNEKHKPSTILSELNFVEIRFWPFIPVAITAQTPTIQQSSWSSI